MDLSQLSTEDLLALKGGDLSKVSTAGLQTLRRFSTEPTIADKAMETGRDLIAGAVRGAGSIGATLVDLARSKLADDVQAATPVNMRPDVSKDLPNLPRGNAIRQGMDAGLQEMGADPSSPTYQGGKLLGEIGSTAGAGGALANGLARVAPSIAARAPALVEAIRSGGFTTGQRVAPGVLNAVNDAGIRAAGGAINGGLSAGLVDPSEAPVGAVVGGAVPVAVKVAGAAGKTVGQAVSGKLAKDAAVRKVVSTVGDDAVPQTIADIQTYYPKGAENIPVSAAAATTNPKLAQLEQASRLRAGDAWYGFDQKQGKAVYDNVLKATDEATQLGQRASDRADNWTAAWQKAADNLKPRLWQQRMTQFGDDMESALRSPESSNPNVRGVLEAINNEMDRVGPDFSIGHLQQLRANLNGKVQPMSSDVFKSAPRDNPAIISIKKEMDDILNTATGGKWQKVIEGYAKDSEALHASKAAQKVRNAFVDGETGRVRGVSLDPNGDVPKITEAGLGRAMDAARLPDQSLALSSEANDRLTATIDALRRQNIIQDIKRTASAGGGSNTPADMAAVAAHSQHGLAPNLLMQALHAVGKLGTAKVDNQVAALLTNPEELTLALSDYLRPRPSNALAEMVYRTSPVLAGRLATGQ